MRLVMITRKVDAADALAGFAHQWVTALANRLDRLYVITWQPSAVVGLPDNVTLISLPKHKLLKCLLLTFHTIKLVSKTDGLFCHMNPEYTILAAPWFRLVRKQVVIWYTHRAVTWRLRIAAVLASKILTASMESFRLKSKKVIVVGHGINTEFFVPPTDTQSRLSKKCLTIGRLSPTKQYELMVEAIALLQQQEEGISLDIIGDIGLPNQVAYRDALINLVTTRELGSRITFLGPIAHREIVPFLQQANVFINLSATGSLDKAVLEAMACGCLVLTSNPAFRPILPEIFFINDTSVPSIARSLTTIFNLSVEQGQIYRHQLREIVVQHHNLQRLAEQIIIACQT